MNLLCVEFGVSLKRGAAGSQAEELGYRVCCGVAMFKKILAIVFFAGAVLASDPQGLSPRVHRAKALEHFRKARQIKKTLKKSLTPEKDKNLAAIHGELRGLHDELAKQPASGKKDPGLRVRLNGRYEAVSRLYSLGADHAKDAHEKIWYKDMARQYRDESRGGSLMRQASAQQHQKKMMNAKARVHIKP